MMFLLVKNCKTSGLLFKSYFQLSSRVRESAKYITPAITNVIAASLASSAQVHESSPPVQSSDCIQPLDFGLFHTGSERPLLYIFNKRNGQKSCSYNITPVIYIAGSLTIHYGKHICCLSILETLLCTVLASLSLYLYFSYTHAWWYLQYNILAIAIR